ncbi:MAG: cohesin domain-containing protein [Myxococcota bacterium]|nr:cohesin domain-containing protein [Myxococcota bacterium]
MNHHFHFVLCILTFAACVHEPESAVTNEMGSGSPESLWFMEPAHAPNKGSETATPLDAAVEPEVLPRAHIRPNRESLVDNRVAESTAMQTKDYPQEQNVFAPEALVAIESNASTGIPDVNPHITLRTTGAFVGAGATIQGSVHEYALRIATSVTDISVEVDGVVFDTTHLGAPVGLSLQLTPLRGAYDVSDNAQILVQLTADGETPVAAFPVVASAANGQSTCTTDPNGICVLSMNPHVASYTATVEAGGVTQYVDINVSQPSYPAENAIGVQIPTTPKSPGDIFEVPVYLSTTGSVPGAYDMRLHFDPNTIAVVGITGGDCEGMGSPVSNVGMPEMNGTLRFNAITADGNAACLNSSETAHVATVILQVLSIGDGTTDIQCEVKDYLGFNFNPLGTACTGDGSLELQEVAATHLFLAATDTVLDDRELIDGTIETATLHTTMVMSDGTIGSPDAAITVADAVHATVDGMVVAPGVTAGTTTVTANTMGLSASTTISTRRVKALTVMLDDDVLETIDDGARIQPTRIRVFGHWATGSEIFYADVTSGVENRIILPEGFLLTDGTLIPTSATAGVHTVTIAGTNGSIAASTEFTVSSESVALEGLQVKAVCSIDAALDAEQRTYTLTVDSSPAPNAPCALQTHAWFTDGHSTVIPVSMGVEHDSHGAAQISHGVAVVSNAQPISITSSWLGATTTTTLE